MKLSEYTESELEAELERRKLRCEARGCEMEAGYEGWYHVLDLSGNQTGLNRRGNFCKVHARVLIGWKPEMENTP